MAVTGAQVSVTSSAALLVAASNSSYPANEPRIIGKQAAITNNGSVTVYLHGDNTVSTSCYPLAAGATVTIDLGPDEAVYGITSSGTASCGVLAARG